MAFPSTLLSKTAKASGDTITSAHYNTLQDELAAVEAKIGVDTSVVNTSIDYKLRYLPAQSQTWTPGQSITQTSLLIWDGWSPAAETWTYASASTFTVSGDVTAKYVKGTKIKWTQTTVKYGIVLSSSYSAPNTTVTIVVNTDYTVANAAISANYVSYVEAPPGFPFWFAWTPSWTNASVGNGTVTAKYIVKGKVVHIAGELVFGSTTSISGSVYFTLPMTAVVASATYAPNGICIFLESGASGYKGIVNITAADATKGRLLSEYVTGTKIAFEALSATVPFTWGTADALVFEGTYQIA